MTSTILLLSIISVIFPCYNALAPSSSPIAPFLPSRIPLNGVQHYIRDTGDPSSSSTSPPPIAILLHGLAGSTDSWEDIAPLLHKSGIRAIAIDRVGFGRTERPQPPQLPLPPFLPPSSLRDSVAKAIESLPAPSPPGVFEGIFPTPNAVLATAIRRPDLLVPRLPWDLARYGGGGVTPYSSEFAALTIGPLLRSVLSGGGGGGSRKIYLVGHSAGGPIALRAFTNAVGGGTKGKGRTNDSLLPSGCDIAGAVLIAPAVLDPEEDPGAYDYDDNDPSNNDSKESEEPPIWLRQTLFRTVLSLPDVVGVPIARRIFDGRNITQALLNQTGVGVELSEERVRSLAEKYLSPVEEFPEEWDVGLLNVYRADMLGGGSSGGEGKERGRNLLRLVREGAERLVQRQVTTTTAGIEKETKSEAKQQPTFCVITGEDDRVVPAKASRKVADLLGAGGDAVADTAIYVEMKGVGHLPMDERPEELAEVLVDFMKER